MERIIQSSGFPLVAVSKLVTEYAHSLDVSPEIHANDFVFQFILNALWGGDYDRAARN
jgi:hypothetical protein